MLIYSLFYYYYQFNPQNVGLIEFHTSQICPNKSFSPTPKVKMNTNFPVCDKSISILIHPLFYLNENWWQIDSIFEWFVFVGGSIARVFTRLTTKTHAPLLNFTLIVVVVKGNRITSRTMADSKILLIFFFCCRLF